MISPFIRVRDPGLRAFSCLAGTRISKTLEDFLVVVDVMSAKLLKSFIWNCRPSTIMKLL